MTDKKRKKIILIVVCFCLVALVCVALFLGITISNGEKNLKNVYIGTINVGEFTQKETISALKKGGWEDIANTPLVVTTFADTEIEIYPIEAGATLSLEDAALQAYAYGHSGNVIENLFNYIKTLIVPVDINKRLENISSEYLSSKIDEGMAKAKETIGKEEYVIDKDNSALIIFKGKDNLQINKDLFINEISEALRNNKKTLTYKAVSNELTAPDFTTISKELNKTPTDAYYTEDNKFEVVDEIVGCTFDIDDALSIWNDAQPGDKVSIPVIINYPNVTGEFLRGQLFNDLLGAMTTEFPASAEERVSNVNLCSSKINGYIVYPGEVFSYNEVVGPRTTEAGFKDAPVYSDGEVKTEPGGGACQVSSTLYAATLFAFLETVDRTCHQFKVSYMQMGTDATVAWPEDGGNIVDFKFKNNKNYPIKIVSICDTENKNITVELWGTLEEDDYMPVEFDNRYTYINTYDRWIEPAYPDREAYSIKLSVIGDIYSITNEETGQPEGIRTLTHRYVIDSSGNTVYEDIVNMYQENIKGPGMDTYYIHP